MNTKVGKYRFRILALLFTATTINYMDRAIIGVLAPTLQYKVFNWSEEQYSLIITFFMIAYAIGMLTMGGIIDRFGTRVGYTISIAVWSVFGMLHAAVRPAFGLIGFILARFGLGLGEAGNFPAANKTVAEWFPKKERALAIGIFNAGANIGAILAPLIVPLVVLANGQNWQYAFLITGAFSAIWIVLWLRTYKKPALHPKVSREELEYINSDSIAETEEKISWLKLFPVKQTWTFAIGKISDAVWWFYLFWGGKFLYDKFGLNIKEVALPLICIFLVADIGSITGGYISSYFLKKGWTANKARKLTMLGCAFIILPVVFVTSIPSSFTVDDQLFHELSSASYIDKKIEVIRGKQRNKKVERKFPPESINRLQPLLGNSYVSAKQFSADLKQVLPAEKFAAIEPVIHKYARSNKLYWFAVLLISLAAAGHTAWMANLFSMVSDVFPKKAIASVTGIGGMVGAIAGLIASISLGQVLATSGPAGYLFAFLVAGLIYLVLLGTIHLIMPKMTPLNDDLKPL